MVEACVVGLAAVPAVAGFLAIAYFIFARAWSQHWAYEAAICIAREESPPACERRLRNALASALPIGRIQAARAWRSGATAWAEARVEILPCKQDSELCLEASASRQVALPLASASKRELGPARATRASGRRRRQ
jgi:hypothetical protein